LVIRWGLTRAPQELVDALKKKLHDNIDTAPKERKVNVIESETEESRPLFIENHELNKRVLDELKPMHEEWAGVDLVGEIAYGLRGKSIASNHMKTLIVLYSFL